jgi:hypothetical protein
MSGHHRRATAAGGGTVAVAILAAASIGAPSVPAADLPTVQVPSTPSLPQTPSVPQAPEVPHLPSAPQAPSAPPLRPSGSLPSPPAAVHPSAPAGAGAAGPSARRVVVSGFPSAGAPSTGRRSAGGLARSRKPARGVTRSRSLRRFRSTVRRLRGCFYAISRFERRVVALRAGIGRTGPLSRRAVARRLDVSTRRVRRLEGRAVRRLRSANRADGCGGAGAGSGSRRLGPSLATGKAANLLAPGVVLGRAHGSRASKAGRSAVLGASQSSGGKETRQRRISGLAVGTPGPSDGDGGLLIPATAAGLLFLSGLLVLVLRPAARR